MPFGLDKFTRFFFRSKNTSDLVFIPRCVAEAIEKVDRPENTSTPKETVSSIKRTQNIQEQVIFFGDPDEVLKALTSPAPNTTPANSPSNNAISGEVRTGEEPRVVLEAIEKVTPEISHARPAVVSTAGTAPLDSRQAVIGRDFETGGFVTVGEEERCGGLYVLDQPRTGKSELLISLALTDIEAYVRMQAQLGKLLRGCGRNVNAVCWDLRRLNRGRYTMESRTLSVVISLFEAEAKREVWVAAGCVFAGVWEISASPCAYPKMAEASCETR